MEHLDRIFSKVECLADPNEFEKHEVVMQELCEAAHEFNAKFFDDLDFDRTKTQHSQEDLAMKPQLCQVLNNFEDGEADFQSLWTHMVLYRRRAFAKRNEISLNTLASAMTTVRSTLEEISSDKSLSSETRDKLGTLYGDRLFKCSKINCFYFHEGFKYESTRDDHVRRHDRPFSCTEPDCIAAEFGFGSQRDLEQHKAKFHLVPEAKAEMFKDIKPETVSHAKYDCVTCGKSFVRLSILKDHKLTHTGQKPHECSRCGKAFTRKNDCQRHEKIHDKRR